jgi:hypothetical protein
MILPEIEEEEEDGQKLSLTSLLLGDPQNLSIIIQQNIKT